MAIDADLLQRIRQIWSAARSHAARSVNSAHVAANWLIGQQIVEAEQGGADRATYGTRLLRSLSTELASEYGDGFSLSALKYMRQFYIAYPDLLGIGHALRDQFASAPGVVETAVDRALRIAPTGDPSLDWKPGRLHPALSWTHYRTLLKVTRQPVRDFYEIEAVQSGWSARQLERQINSLLFERLLNSRDKAGVMALATEGVVAHAPVDIIKDPYVLEFLDLPESHRLVESRVEEALITELRSFLLELGSGCAFVGRQPDDRPDSLHRQERGGGALRARRGEPSDLREPLPAPPADRGRTPSGARTRA